jgi:adenylate cyclase
MERRLAAILMTDIVGYSRLIGLDEEGTIARQTVHREEIIEPTVTADRGRIVNTTGDGLLVEFTSVVDAVRCAVRVQQKLVEHELDLPEDQRIWYRMGINLGDVVIDGNDILGDGVNVAARLEGLAEPGGICISGTVHDELLGKVDVVFKDAGEQTVKNIARPVRVWRWQAGPTALISNDIVMPPQLPAKPSIVALPFANLSGDPEQEYFVDGITEDIITALSRLRWLFVIARNSSFTYKRHAIDVKQVASEMGVRYVLEGSVRKAGDRLRVTAQLSEADAGNQIWAERYDRKLEDIFDLQDEMTAMIVGALEPEIGAAERDRAKRRAPDNLDAWDRYQCGLWHLWRYTRDDSREAEALFESAISLDSEFGSAHSGIALVLYNQVLFGWTDDAERSFDRALEAAQKAVLLDDKDAIAHFSLGRLHALQGRFDAAIAEERKAIDCNPNLALAYWGLGMALAWSGRPREALPYCLKAIRQSPHDPAMWVFENLTGMAHLQLREHSEAIKWFTSANQYQSASFWASLNLAVAFVETDQLDKARTALDAARKLQPRLSVAVIKKLIRHIDPDYLDRYFIALARIGLTD